MTLLTGKRKRQDYRDDSDVGAKDEDATRELFQRAFEAKFKPLERMELTMKKADKEVPHQDFQLDEEPEWSGLSDDEELVETIRHDESHYVDHDTQRHERKAFMVSWPFAGMNLNHINNLQVVETSKFN